MTKTKKTPNRPRRFDVKKLRELMNAQRQRSAAYVLDLWNADPLRSARKEVELDAISAVRAYLVNPGVLREPPRGESWPAILDPRSGHESTNTERTPDLVQRMRNAAEEISGFVEQLETRLKGPHAEWWKTILLQRQIDGLLRALVDQRPETLRTLSFGRKAGRPRSKDTLTELAIFLASAYGAPVEEIVDALAELGKESANRKDVDRVVERYARILGMPIPKKVINRRKT